MGLAEIYSGISQEDRLLLEAVGVRPVTDSGVMFCGVTEAFAISGVTYQWARGSELSWGIEFSRLGSLSDMDCKDAITAALKEISECSDVKHRYAPNANGANFKMIATRLDGASGVLADFQIPVGNVSTVSTTLLGRFDDGENWVLSDTPQPGQIDFYRVALHELEHGHGMGHRPANIPGAALIAPIYDRNIRHLQQLDKDELIRRYGINANGPTVPPASATVVEVKNMIVSVNGVNYTASGKMKLAQ